MIDSPYLKHLDGYIDGAWVPADSGKTFDVKNPATGELLAQVAAMGVDETDRAVTAAEAARFNGVSFDQRVEWLLKIEAELLAGKDEIGRILTMEHGKPLAEAIAEVEYAAGFFRGAAESIDSIKPHTLDTKPRGFTWTVHYRPAGTVALVTPWNFPIGMIAKKLAPAIAANCPSVTKASSKTPLSMIALFSILHDKLDLPKGFVNLLSGSAGPISDALCADERVTVLSFTGSTGIGVQLIDKTKNHCKRLALELGGNAPFIVFEDADLDKAADNLAANKFRGGGQTCVCANRLLVQKSVIDAFTDKFVERVRKIKVGNGLDEGVTMGPLIDKNGFNKVREHIQDALEKGAHIVTGQLMPLQVENHGCFHPPTVLRGVTPSMACFREETFGPLAPIIEFDTEEEAIRLANDTEFGLASYVFSGDLERAERVAERIHFGHCGINTGTGPTPEAPFGGMLESGWGREGGTEGLHEFVEPQTIPHG